MYQGKTLVELAQEVDRQNSVKKDYIIDTRSLEYNPVNESLDIVMDNRDIQGFKVNENAHKQIANRLKSYGH